MKVRIFALCLCLSLLSACAAGGESDPGPAVQEHWDAITQAGQEQELLPTIGSRWYDQYMDVVLPQGDYGELVPYEGARVRSIYEYLDENGQEQIEYAGYHDSLYGLITLDGKIVLDPVCSRISQAVYYDDARKEVWLPVWALVRVEDGAAVTALCALDGSWATDFVYWGAAPCPQGIVAADETGVHLLDENTGEEQSAWTWEQLGLDQSFRSAWTLADPYDTPQWFGDRFCLGLRQEGEGNFTYCLDLNTGEVTRMASADWYRLLERRFSVPNEEPVQSSEDGTVTVTRNGQTYQFQSPLADRRPYLLGEDRVIFDDDSSDEIAMTDLTGRVILPPTEHGRYTVDRDNLWLILGNERETLWTVYDREGKLLAELPGEKFSMASEAGRLVEIAGDTQAAYYNTQTWECVFRVYFGLGDVTR